MSYQLNIELHNNICLPESTLSGKASWQLKKQPRSVYVRLFWKTAGKGSEDTEIVAQCVVPQPSQQQEFNFSFELPDSPYSYQGNLLSISWGVEVVIGKRSEMASFVMAPDGIIRNISILNL